MKALKLLLLTLFAALGLSSYASYAKIDGIYYNLISKAKTAEVTSVYYAEYSGKIVIPSTIDYDGITYSVTTIDKEAFYNCESLTSITIPASVTTIGNLAFKGCKSLTSITIPASVTTIGAQAFSGCKSLTSVTIPYSVTSIGGAAFRFCESLTSITIPASVTTIGDYAFNGCDLLTTITVDPANPNYCSQDNVLFDKAMKTLLFCPETKEGAYTIPNSVTTIGNSAFTYCSSLTSVNIPASVTYIEYSTLYVPAEVIDTYKKTSPWSSFGTILDIEGNEPIVPELPKCQAPEITYADATLNITSATLGAKCYYSIECEDATETMGVQGPIKLAKTYIITAYAEADGFKTSEPTILKLSSSQLAEGDVDGNGKLSISDVTTLVNNILKK